MLQFVNVTSDLSIFLAISQFIISSSMKICGSKVFLQWVFKITPS